MPALKQVQTDSDYHKQTALNDIKNNIKENDILLTLGAGTVTKIGPMLIEK